MRIVANSTPIIGLAKISRLFVLREVFGRIEVPEAVYTEVVQGGSGRPGAAEAAEGNWIVRRTVGEQKLLRFLRVSLDAGEAEAVALASEISADLVLLDDRAGRRVAKGIGLRISGTVGVLLHYYEGNAAGFEAALSDLMNAGFRLSEAERLRIVEEARSKRS